MTLAYQRFTAVLLLIYGNLSEWHLLLSECVLVCRRKNIEISFKTWQEGRRNQRDVSASLRDKAVKKTATWQEWKRNQSDVSASLR
jgi:hypothetical protein